MMMILLTDKVLSAIFKKTTEEALKFNDKKAANEIGVMKDCVLFCKSHLLESKNVRAVEDLEIGVNLKSFTGVRLVHVILENPKRHK